jgi:hypothetical protein
LLLNKKKKAKNQWWIKLKVEKKLAEMNPVHVVLEKNLSIAVVLYKI